MGSRIKEYTKALTGYPFKSSKYSKTGVKLARGINVKEGVFNWKSIEKWDNLQPFLDKYFLKEKDVLIQMDGSKVGKNFCIVKNEDLPILLVQRVTRLRTKKNLIPEFLFYTLACKQFLYWITITKTDPMVPHIAPKDINNFLIPLPTKEEQIQIANYLEFKTKVIDKKIYLLLEKFAIYKEYRKTLINETITKGLNKKVGLKDSEIKWIGEIPKHWEVKRFKHFAKTIKGKKMTTSDNYFDKSLPLITLEYLRNESVQHPTFAYSNDYSLKTSNEDFIIVWDGAAVGEIINAKKGFLSSTIAKIEINKKLYYPKYFYHLRDTIDYTVKQIPTGMGIPHLNPNLLKNFICPYPPLEEQIEIAEFLDKKTEVIDKIIGNIKKQIKTLKELRKTLIDDVVTGKIKVGAEKEIFCQ